MARVKPRSGSGGLLAGVFLAVGLAGGLLGGLWLNENNQATPPPATIAPEQAATVAKAVGCEQLGITAIALADQIDNTFLEHAHAHHLYVQKKIAFGPVDKPNTVLWIWRKTLADRARFAKQYHQVRDSYVKGCNQ